MRRLFSFLYYTCAEETYNELQHLLRQQLIAEDYKVNHRGETTKRINTTEHMRDITSPLHQEVSPAADVITAVDHEEDLWSIYKPTRDVY